MTTGYTYYRPSGHTTVIWSSDKILVYNNATTIDRDRITTNLGCDLNQWFWAYKNIQYASPPNTFKIKFDKDVVVKQLGMTDIDHPFGNDESFTIINYSFDNQTNNLLGVQSITPNKMKFSTTDTPIDPGIGVEWIKLAGSNRIPANTEFTVQIDGKAPVGAVGTTQQGSNNVFIALALQIMACNAGSTAPTLSSTSATVCRSNPFYNLSSVGSTTPAGATLKWYTTPSLTTEITNLNVKEGTYYAAFYDATAGCRSPYTAFSVILDTDCDGIGDFYDWDDDNDGILDIVECPPPSPLQTAITPAAPNSWTAGNYTIYSAGGNTDGLGYQKSGYQQAVINSKNYLTVLNGTNDFQFAGNTATFANGTVDFTKTFIGTPSTQFTEYFKKSSIDEFRSSNTGDGINATIAGDAQVGSTYSLNINFTKPVYAFSFDLLDAFDSYSNYSTNLIVKYEVFVNGTLVSYIDGNHVGNDLTGTRSVKDASGVVKGSYTVGNNMETNFGIISKVPIGNVEIRYTVVTLGYSGGAYDPIGLDMFTYSVESCANSRNLDSDGDGCPDAIEGDENVTNANLNADGSINTSITGGIDANGVPKLVNSGGAADIGSDLGQGIGISQDPTQKEAAKITNTTPTSQTICLNGTAAPITVTATGSAGLRYQWYVNTTNTTIGGTAVSGATTNTFTPPTTEVGEKYYYLVATDNCGDATSAIVRVEVLPTPSVSLTASPAQICYGTTPAPTVTITNNSSYSVLVTYKYNTVNQTPVSIPAFGTKEIGKPTAVGTYTYQLVNAKYDGAGMPGCEVTLTESKTVEIVALPAISATVTNISCKGETNGSVTLTSGTGYTYSKDGVNWQSSNVFSGLAAGSYTFYAKNPSGCTSSTTAKITEPAITINASVYVKPLICDATTTTITVTPPTGTGKAYEYKITDGTSTIGWQTSNIFTIEDKSYKVYIKESGDAADATCNYLGEFSPTNECVQITKTATYTSSDGTPKTFINQVGDKILYTIKIENLASSSNTLYDVVITDARLKLVGVTSINVGTLAPGGSFTATSTTYPNLAYTVTQEDLDACEIVNTASFTANVNTTNGVISIKDDASHTTPISSSPSWTLDKTAVNKTKPAAPGQPTTYSDENEIIEFTITLKNTGNVSISNISLQDPDYNGGAKVFYSLNGGILLPGESWVVTYSHTIELADLINNCSHTNPVTVSGIPSCGTLADITKSLTLAKKIIVPKITANDVVQPNCDVRTGSVTLNGTPYPGTFIVTAYADEVFYGKIERTNQTAVTFTGLAPGKSYTFVISQPGDCFSGTTAAVAMNNIECIIAFDDMNQVPAGVPTSGNVLTNDFYTGSMPTVTAQVYNSSGVLTPLTIGTSTTIYPSSGGTTPAGVITLNADGTYTFVPADGFTGNVPVQYTITDSQGASSTAYLSITVLPAVKTGENNPPVANKDTYAVESGVTAVVKVLENDSDPDKDPISVTGASYVDVNNNFTPISENSASPTPILENGVQIGTAYVNKTDGQIVFTPYETYNGTVNFNYEISDGKGGTDSAFVQVVVLLPDAANDVIANDDANAAPKDKPMTGNILNNDYSNSKTGNLSVTSASSNGSNLYISPSADNTFVNEIPEVGTIVIYSDGKYVFEPVLGYVGTTPISYRTCDDTGVCDMAKLYLTSLETDIKFWTGIKTDEFDNPENWTSGVVPKNGENVVFATPENTNGQTDTYNDMVIPSGSTVTIHNLTNESEYATVVPPNTSLTITGTIVGSETDASKLVVEAGTDGTTPNGTLIITGMDCDVNVLGTVEFHTKAKEELPALTWTDNITGSPTIGKDFTTKYHWQYFGIPVKKITQAIDYFANSYIREYDETINLEDRFYQKWKNITTWSEMTAFKGYEITHDAANMPAGGKTYSLQGALNFCNEDLIMTRQAPYVAPKAGDSDGKNQNYGLGQNIFGNSFTAAIKIDKIKFSAKTEKTVYLYNTGRFYDWATTGKIVTDATQTNLVAGNYLSIPQNTPDVWDNQIPSMQGFLLKFTQEQTVVGDTAKIILTYANESVVKNTKPQLVKGQSRTTGFQPVEKAPLSYLRINLQSNSTIDNLWLFSEAGTTEKFDNGWDGRKFFGTPTAFIFTQTPDGPMQVNTNSTIDGTPITLYSNSDTDYTLTLVKTNLDEYQDLHLIDFAAKTVTPLTADTTRYRFTSVNKGTTEKRFMIVNKNSANIDLNNGGFDLMDGYISPDKVLTAMNYTGETGTMSLYSTTGSLIMNEKMNLGANHYPTTLTAGAYIMQLQSGGKKKTVKLMVERR